MFKINNIHLNKIKHNNKKLFFVKYKYILGKHPNIIKRKYNIRKINKNVYFVPPAGIGDLISMRSAVYFLSLLYNTVYVFHKSFISKNAIELYSHLNNVQMIPINMENINKDINAKKYVNGTTFYCINKINKIDDIIISIPTYFKYIKNRITHPQLLNYKPFYHKNNECIYKNVQEFYKNIHLDNNIYYDFFNIPNTPTSIELYNKIKHYKIIFIHTISQNKTIIIPNKYLKDANDENTIIINPDKNYYNPSDIIKYELAQSILNNSVMSLITIIKNAHKIYVINSCFSCMIYPLSVKNELAAKHIIVFNRETSRKVYERVC